ncbi:hypothetical protein Alexa_003 [Acinetobacter phage vB_AbaP_Alexa]|nr:hypothetical protein Alexa_003 [Acinetobacter phage vB_AbaP_Alexa]
MGKEIDKFLMFCFMMIGAALFYYLERIA